LDALVKKGEILFSLERYEEAIKIYRKIVEISPQHFPEAFWIEKGKTLHRIKRYSEAIDYYNIAIDVYPNYIFTWRYKGLALAEIGKLDDAIKSYDVAIKMKPDYVDALIDKGNAIYKLGWFDDAIYFYNRALEIEPKSSAPWLNKAIILLEQKNYGEAVINLENAIKLDTVPDVPLYLKGEALKRMGKNDEARESFKKAIEIISDIEYDTSDPDPWIISKFILKGEIFFALEDYSEAKYYFNRVLTLDKYNLDALHNLALIYTDHTYEYHEALEIDRRLLEIDPEDVSAKLGIIEDLIEIGEFKNARKLASRYSKDFKESADHKIIDFFLLTSYLLEGNASEGNRLLQVFFEKYLKFEKEIIIRDMVFDGLINFINNYKTNLGIKFLLIAILDLLQGKLNINDFSFFGKSRGNDKEKLPL
jgi:tetratricopeptide (TPR) repeat protein